MKQIRKNSFAYNLFWAEYKSFLLYQTTNSTRCATHVYFQIMALKKRKKCGHVLICKFGSIITLAPTALALQSSTLKHLLISKHDIYILKNMSLSKKENK